MCDESCNSVENLFGRIYVPSKMEDVNLIKRINQSTILVINISCKCKCEFDGRKCNS